MVPDLRSRSSRALVETSDHQSLPQVYLAKVPDHGGPIPPDPHGGLASRLKWIVSTCLVGAAGICVIVVVMYASMDFERTEGILSSIRKAGVSAFQPKKVGKIVHDQPEITFGQKTDRIKLTAKGVTTSHIIHDSVVVSRGSTDFIEIKPYVLIEASLATDSPGPAADVPKFDPFELYANKKPVTDPAGESKPKKGASDNIAISYNNLQVERLVMLDDHFISAKKAEQLVAEAAAVLAESGAEFETAAEVPADALGDEVAATRDAEASAPNTTIVTKTPEPEPDPTNRFRTTSVDVRSGNTLYALLSRSGASSEEAKDIVAAIKTVPGAAQLETGQELRFTHVRADTPGEREGGPIRVSLYDKDDHVVSVTRTSSGEYAATRDESQVAAFAGSGKRYTTRATLYQSIFFAALSQDLPQAVVMKFLRTLAYDVDFKQRVGFGDRIQLFYDVEREPSGIAKPGNLLFASMTVDGESYEYYRFRTPDGRVDFYDAGGSNSRKFLMREPVKGARFTSGFGYRRHPILGTRRMHTGTDWAAPRGTPILAPGDGTVVFAGRKGGYGNHIRIRHGNGYKTTFSHMQKFAKNIRKGVKVQQGQVIGYIGSTGRSTGPHLHYEVLVNDQFTDPMKIATGSSRQLKGRLLAEFKREKRRINKLMRRAPVKTQVAAVSE